MRASQKVVLWTAIALLAALLVYPPWTYTLHHPGMETRTRPAGYALLTRPPPPEIDDPACGVEIDYGRLVLPVLLVVLVAGGFLVTLRTGPHARR